MDKIKSAVAGFSESMGSPPPVKVSLKEGGKILGFSYPTMLALANREDFPAFKCMGKWIIPYEQLMEWLRKQAGGEGR